MTDRADLAYKNLTHSISISILDYMRERQMTLSQLSSESQVPFDSLENMVSGYPDPKLNDIYRLVQLGVVNEVILRSDEQ